MSHNLEVACIYPDPEQPRRSFDEGKINELARSMEEQGQAAPITVRPDEKENRHIIVAGERRWRAAQKLGWNTVRADVRNVGREEAQRLALIENIQREDLTPIEEAHAYMRQLMEHDLTQTELAEKLGKTQSHIAQRLRLLDVPSPILYWIESGVLSQSHIRQLQRMKGFFLEGADVAYGDDPYEEAWEPETAHLYVMAERPTDWPLYILDQKGEQKQTMLHSALERYFEYVAEQDQVVDAWVRAAWFFGATAYWLDMSVSTLSGVIDRFEGRVRSHYMTVAASEPGADFSGVPIPKYEFQEQTPTSRGDEVHISDLDGEEIQLVLERLYYWGAEGDLRHADLLGALNATMKTLPGGKTETSKDEGSPDLNESELEANIELLRETANQEEDTLPPTMVLHPGSPAHQKWEEIEDRLTEIQSGRD